MQVGDRMNWRWISRGGYGYSQNVACVVIKINPKTIRIRTAIRKRSDTDPSGWYWETVEKNVSEQYLTPREKYVPEVDDRHETEERMLAEMPRLHRELVARTIQGMKERGEIKIVTVGPKKPE